MKKLLILGLLIALCIVVSPVLAATITTDKLDYAPEEIVTISGAGFTYQVPVTVTVTRPNGDSNAYVPYPQPAIPDESGSFSVSYQLDGIVGLYTVDAIDSNGLNAQTTFTDDQAFQVKFASSGLPAATTVQVTYNYYHSGTCAYTTNAVLNFNSPGPSGVVNTGHTQKDLSCPYELSYSFLTTIGSCSLTSPSSGTVTGSSGDLQTVTATYTCPPPNTPPVAEANGPYSGNIDDSISFYSTGSSDSDGSIASYDWNWGDGTAHGTGASPTHAYSTSGTKTVTLTVTDDDGATGTDEATVNVNAPPVVAADNDPVTVDEGQTAGNTGTVSDPDGDAITLTASIGDVTDNGDETWSWSYLTTDGPADSQTVTITATDEYGAKASATFALTVNNVAPTATFAANPTTLDEGSSFTLSLINPVDVTADLSGLKYAFDCGDGSGYGSFGSTDSISCPTKDNGDRSVKGKIKDKDGGASDYTASVTVNNVAPYDLALILVPTVPINENDVAKLSGTFKDPGTLDTHTVEIDWGDGSAKTTVNLAANVLAFGPESHQYLDDPSGTPDDYTISVTVTDKDNDAGTATKDITVNNVAPTVGAISGFTLDPIKVGISIPLVSATFTDPGTLDTHTALWDWDDGTTSAGTVTESGGSGSVSGSHSYLAAGIYTISVTVTDKDGGSGTSTATSYIVVYDPNGGFVTGGGWIDSPKGAWAADPTMTGKANFGFVSKYKKGATAPEGETEFQFKAGNLNFHSSSYQWLVVAGSKAIYKGSGTINGAGTYGFLLSAIDGSPDKFRIKIQNGDITVYDNQVSGETGDDASPTTSIVGGSIVVHK